MRYKDTSDLEISLLLEAVYRKYGYDFRQYSQAHVRRRIMNRMTISGFEDVSQLQSKVLNDSRFASDLLQDLSITVTEMFRDPAFYRALREKIIPILQTYP
ncbi:MAG: protein-glutamate O-methyltransferase CheR, partial [bacterium]|nr:protein-glutamate O-methyltransferase CheR [bacterium]